MQKPNCKITHQIFTNDKTSIFFQLDNEDLQKKNMKFLILAKINLRRLAEAKQLIQELGKHDKSMSLFLLAKCHFKIGEYKKALNLLVENCCENSEWWREIGIIYWYLGEYKASFSYFLKVRLECMTSKARIPQILFLLVEAYLS